MYFPSRRERRAFAKKLGRKKKDETHKEWLERINRSHEAGKQIHLQRLQQSFNNQINAESQEINLTTQPAGEPNTTPPESNISE
jgi:hypothetical protein